MRVIPTPKDILKARKYKLKSYGIKYPATTVWAARQANIPLSYACALLEQETGGGSNVFGHDPTIYVGAGKVTEAKYKAYKKARGKTHMQGVGPVQLTWWATQDAADALGGCWRPGINMLVGFKQLKANVSSKGVHQGVKAYNGTGPAADAYAQSWMAKEVRWAQRFKR